MKHHAKVQLVSPLIGEQMLQLASMTSYHMAINIYIYIYIYANTKVAINHNFTLCITIHPTFSGIKDCLFIHQLIHMQIQKLKKKKKTIISR